MKKKNEKIYDAIANISDEKIESAADHKYEKSPGIVKRILLTAAAAALCIGTVCTPIAMMRNHGEENPHSASSGKPSALRVCAAEYPTSGDLDNKNSDIMVESLKSFFTASAPEFLKNDGETNRIISPLNIYTALGMLAESAGGNSRRQLTDLLGESDTAVLREQISVLNKSIYADEDKVKCRPAASLWMANNRDYNKDTLDILAKNYIASSFVGDVGSEEYDNMLRDWVNEQTNGILSEYTDEIEMDRDTAIVLLTTLYCDFDWYKQIESYRTSEGTFHTNGGDVSCDFMADSDALYYEGESFCAATKEFADQSYSMSFILPNEGIAPAELLSDRETVDFIFSEKLRPSDPQAEYEACRDILIPKFDIATKLDLIPALKELGINDVFDGDAADLSPLYENSSGKSVTKADQAVRVKIDEAGCEAAAYVEIEMKDGSSAVDAIIFDRPFIFTVDKDGVPLFTGIVNNPAA